MKKIVWLLGLIVFGVVFSINYDYGMIAAAVMILAIGVTFHREKTWGWVPAILITWTFIFFARNMYASGYKPFKISILGVSLFPILAWPSILMMWYFLYPPMKKNKSWYKKWMELSLFYCAGIILFEYIGYNFFGVHLEAGKKYPGWPVLHIFHSPWWMQLAYFINGILFAAVFSYVDHHVYIRKSEKAKVYNEK